MTSTSIVWTDPLFEDGLVRICNGWDSPSAAEAHVVRLKQIGEMPIDQSYDLIPTSEIPTDRIFREAWDNLSHEIFVDLDIAKDIAHGYRRLKRSTEFQEVDSDNPNLVVVYSAELEREVIREKYAVIQVNIDNANNIEELTYEVRNEGLI